MPVPQVPASSPVSAPVPSPASTAPEDRPDARPASDPAVEVVVRMQADLRAAMKGRDQVATRALRTGMAAIANAEAPAVPAEPADPTAAAGPSGPFEPVVGRLVEHDRLDLTADQVQRVLRREIADRLDTIALITPHGRDDEVFALEGEIAVLRRYLS